MHKIFTKQNIIFLLVLITLLISCKQQQRKLKVICIGDSITQGKFENNTITELSYRFWLWQKLDSVGFNVEMIGSNPYFYNQQQSDQLKNMQSTYTKNTFSNKHESYYGIKIEDFLNGEFEHNGILYPSFQKRLELLDSPDIAFIHIGSNNLNSDSATTIANLKEIIKLLYTKNNNIIIFLAKLNTPWVSFINHSVEPIINEFKYTYPKLLIVAVDMAAGWVNCPNAPNAHTTDWLHPNTIGQKVMANNWYKAFMCVGDRKMPTFIAQTKVSYINDSTALVSWNAATDNKFFAGYNVYVNYKLQNWRYNECNNTKQCIALVTNSQYRLNGLKKGEKYIIAVTALDYANNFASSKEVIYKHN